MEWFSAGPGNAGGLGVEGRLPQDGVVGTFVEVDVDVIFGDADGAAGLDELPIQVLGLDSRETGQLVGQPAEETEPVPARTPEGSATGFRMAWPCPMARWPSWTDRKLPTI